MILDTHVMLWWGTTPERLSLRAREALADPRRRLTWSVASTWEVAIKVRLGKLKLAVPFEELFPGALLTNGFRVLAPDFRRYQELLTLPFHHRDPFDRLLVAQARIEGLTLVSCDKHFAAYGVPLLW